MESKITYRLNTDGDWISVYRDGEKLFSRMINSAACIDRAIEDAKKMEQTK